MRISASKRGAMDLLPRYLSRGSENRRRKPISLIVFPASSSLRNAKQRFGDGILRNLRHKSEPELSRIGCRPRAQNFDIRGCIAPAIFPEPFPTKIVVGKGRASWISSTRR